MTTADVLAGSREKLSRAREHTGLLQSEIEAFIRGFFVADVKYKLTFIATESATRAGVSGNTIPRVHMDIPIPALRWGVIVGDAVHGLRSALDNAIESLTIENAGAPLPRTSFPIFPDQTAYARKNRVGAPARGSGLEAIRGVAPTVASVVERAQPYHAALPRVDPLRLLHELSNLDKHRVPAIVAIYSELPGVGLAREIEPRPGDFDESRILPFEEGLKHVAAVTKGDGKGDSVRMEFKTQTLFGPGPAEGEVVVGTIRAMTQRVQEILDELAAVSKPK